MAVYRPLVLVNGNPRPLPQGDSIETGQTAGGALSNWPDRVNGLLLGTDLIKDLNGSNNYGRNNAYFHRVICGQSEQVNGMAMIVNRPGSLVQGDYSSAAALFSVTGTLLAIGKGGSVWGQGGFRSVPFDVAYNVVAGTQYYLSFVANGDDIPGYASAAGNNFMNVNTALGSYRTFRKFSVTNLNQNQDLTTNIEAVTNDRVFMSLIKM